MRSRTAVRTVLACIATGALVLAGCSSSSGGKAKADGSGKTVLNVGVVPAFPAAAIYLGIKQGFFADQGLDVKPQVAQSGAAEIALALNGQIQSGFISTVVLIDAIAGGAPLQMAAAADVVKTPGYGGLVVDKGSSIHGAADLVGKTVAVNALAGVDNLAVLEAVADSGADPSKVKVIELPYAQMQTALTSKRVDAAVMTDPFFDAAVAAGGVSPFVLPAGVGGDGALISGYFMTKSYIKANPKVVAEFTKAMNESNAYANAHSAAVRAIIPSYTKLPASSVAKAVLPGFDTSLTASQVQPVIDVMKKFKYLKGSVSVSSVVGG